MISTNIAQVKEKIAQACAQVKCLPAAITIVAVAKNREVAQIKEAIDAGITDIGENKVQEAKEKYRSLLGQVRRPIRWHLVGHLQTNKAKEAVKIFDLIHSVDSLHLAQEIDKQAAKISKVQEILIEVKTSPEATKFGIAPQELAGAVKEIGALKNIRIKGLMTIAPLVDNPEKTRPYFRKLKALSAEINALSTLNSQPSTLSMGMTNDFTVAIEEGANMVRIGRAIFEG